MFKSIKSFPKNVILGQTTAESLQALATNNPHLSGLNLALHVHDDVSRVQHHRMQLLQAFQPYGVQQCTWLHQTHSIICHRVGSHPTFHALEGDGLITAQPKHALMMMTADCLPIILINQTATEVANLHAGWRGLAQGIIEQVISTMRGRAYYAYLGTAISQACFEVGDDVRQQFIQRYPAVENAFLPSQQQIGKYYADLYAIARYILQQQGVNIIEGGTACSYQQAEYYSYRRDAKTGRMATFVFLNDDANSE